MEKLKLLIIFFVIGLFVKCSDNNLSSDYFYKQNIFFKNFTVSLVVVGKWEEDCLLYFYDKKGNLIDKTYCLTDPVPIISYLNDSTVLLTYHDSQFSKYSPYDKISREVNPINSKQIKIKVEIKYDNEGNGVGNVFYYKKLKINKDKNLITFFLENGQKKVLKTSNVFIYHDKIEFIEIVKNIFTYHTLIPSPTRSQKNNQI